MPDGNAIYTMKRTYYMQLAATPKFLYMIGKRGKLTGECSTEIPFLGIISIDLVPSSSVRLQSRATEIKVYR